MLVSGRIAGAARQGGAAWSVLQYLLGLRELGHVVHFVEPVGMPSVAPAGGGLPPEARYAARVLSAAGMGGHWSLVDQDRRKSHPRPYAQLVEIARAADVLINISGVLQHDELVRVVPIRAYLDVDPGFTQLWQEVEGIDMRLDGHTHHVTVGLCLGDPDIPVPSCGVEWIHSLPPVVLRHWPAARPPANGPVTSVGNWRSYGTIVHDGTRYGQRAHSLRELADLPSRCADRLVLALGIDPTEHRDLDLLCRSGWVLVDPQAVAGTPRSYRSFVRASKAELGVAKSGYVLSRCGWFSDRSACYLASGRPVVAQDTGFSRHLPTGEGLFAFDGVDAAAGMLAEVSGDYGRHAAAARRIAEDHLDSKIVLGSLLERVGAIP